MNWAKNHHACNVSWPQKFINCLLTQRFTCIMHFVTEWEDQRGEYLAFDKRARTLQLARPNSVNNHSIIRPFSCLITLENLEKMLYILKECQSVCSLNEQMTWLVSTRPALHTSTRQFIFYRIASVVATRYSWENIRFPCTKLEY